MHAHPLKCVYCNQSTNVFPKYTSPPNYVYYNQNVNANVILKCAFYNAHFS